MFRAQEASLHRLYRELHAAPELSWHEVETARRFASELRAAGAEVTTGVGTNGVVGVLRNGPGPTVLVRCDLDALPVKEETGLPFASTRRAPDGRGGETAVMHACGHDLHMTAAVGMARVLALLTNEWKGTVVWSGATALATWMAAAPPVAAPGQVVPAVRIAPAPAVGAVPELAAAPDLADEAERLARRLEAQQAYSEPARDPFRFKVVDAAPKLRSASAPVAAAPVTPPPAVAAPPYVLVGIA